MKIILFGTKFFSFLVALIISVSEEVSSQSPNQSVYLDGEEIGQGVLRSRGNSCYVISPAHVIDSSPEVDVLDTNSNRYSSITFRSYPGDLALVEIDDIDPIFCGTWEIPSNLDQIVNNSFEGFLVLVSEAGTVVRERVDIVETGIEDIRIEPQKDDFEIIQGQSGGSLYIDGAYVGMLKSIHEGEGVVMRAETIESIVGPFFQEQSLTVDTPAEPVKLLSYSIDEKIIREGERVRVEWQTENALRVTINESDVALSGVRNYKPEQDTSYVLTAVGSDSEISEVIDVKVEQIKYCKISAPAGLYYAPMSIDVEINGNYENSIDLNPRQNDDFDFECEPGAHAFRFDFYMPNGQSGWCEGPFYVNNNNNNFVVGLNIQYSNIYCSLQRY